jgi:hypothetical protein
VTADSAKVVGVIDVLATDYRAVGGISVASLSAIGLKITPVTTSVFAVIVAVGTPTYAGSNDLILQSGWTRT